MPPMQVQGGVGVGQPLQLAHRELRFAGELQAGGHPAGYVHE
jgi:hypothetical protein